MRPAEAVYLDWPDVDLVGGRVIVWADRAKTGKRRNAFLPPRAVAALANLGHRDGRVFRTDPRSPGGGQPYADNGGRWGGQIKKAWHGAGCAAQD
jgi:integrase